MIEGMHISKHELSNPSRFWSQHLSEGTQESFVEIARVIPEVQARLDAGIPLSDVLLDPVLGICAGIYFRPENILRVYKGDTFYEFDSNGRHRIIAARQVGYNILVKVIGFIKKKQSKPN